MDKVHLDLCDLPAAVQNKTMAKGAPRRSFVIGQTNPHPRAFSRTTNIEARCATNLCLSLCVRVCLFCFALHTEHMYMVIHVGDPTGGGVRLKGRSFLLCMTSGKTVADWGGSTLVVSTINPHPLSAFFMPVSQATTWNSLPSAPSFVTSFGVALPVSFIKSCTTVACCARRERRDKTAVVYGYRCCLGALLRRQRAGCMRSLKRRRNVATGAIQALEENQA